MAAPTKLPPTVRYAEAEYWESRYQREPSVFEWFFGHTALRRIIRAYISRKKPVLHLGCGTSNLQEGMAKSGYTVVNTDISKVVIAQLMERHAKYPNLSYVVSDCRDMPEFLDCQFGHVIDKGTIDALLCCKQGTDNVMRMLLEAYRVLQPGGSFLLVTLGDPTRRLPLLLDPRLQWKVSLLLLPKISAACQAYVDGKPINDTVKPIDAEGPYEVLDAENIVGLPAGVQYSNFFFAYVCKKQPLQLPQAQGQKAQVPNGWVAGSKELFQKLQKELGLPEDLLAKGRRKRVMVVPAGSSTAGMAGMQLQGSGSSSSSAGGAEQPPQQLAAGGDAVQEARELPERRKDFQDSAAQHQQLQQQQLPSHPNTPDHEQEHGPLSPCYQQQQQQQQQQQVLQHHGLGRSSGTSSMPVSPLSQLHLQRQQQQAAVAKLEAMLASNVAAQLQLQQQQQQRVQAQAQPQQQAAAELHSQQLPAACGIDLQDVPARPASAPNLTQLAHAAAMAGSAASGAAAAGLQAAGEPCEARILQLPEPGVDGPADVSADGNSKQSLADGSAGTGAAAAGAGAAAAAAAPAGSELPSLSAQLQQQLQQAQQVQQQSVDAPAVGLLQIGELNAAPAAAAVAEEAAGPEWSVLGRPSPAEAAALAAGCSDVAAAAAAAGPMMSPIGLPLLPRMSAASVSRVPRLRRFSTDPTAFAMAAALSPQLALLRQAQSQHSERAADGLIMHDVAAAEAYGGGAAAAAALAAAASWGRTRPPRGRRLSGMSVLSNLSTFSSASMSVNGEEDSETQEDCGSSMCTTGESQLIAEGAVEGEGEEECEEGQQQQQRGVGGAVAGDNGSSNADLAAAVSRLAVGTKLLLGADDSSDGCAKQCQQRVEDAAQELQLAPQGDE